jgi:hypothetical protein
LTSKYDTGKYNKASKTNIRYKNQVQIHPFQVEVVLSWLKYGIKTYN